MNTNILSAPDPSSSLESPALRITQGGNGEDRRLRRGTAKFRRANLAMFAAGLSTFSLLYAVQPILPAFSRNFRVSPSQSSLILSVSTATMAVALVFSSGRWRRTGAIAA